MDLVEEGSVAPIRKEIRVVLNLFQIMDNENDITLTDAEGMVLRVSDSYEDHYDVKKEDVVGKSVHELEKKHVFSPSVIVAVIREQKKVTLL